MAFHYKIYFYLFVILFSACEVKIVEPQTIITKTTPVVPIQTRNVNVLGSEYFNWDSITFSLNRVITGFSLNKNSNFEFISNNPNPDTLIIRFDKFPNDISSAYYCGSTECSATLNKFSNQKISSSGYSGAVIYEQINDDFAYITFEFMQNTNYRLPDNSKLKAKISGKFQVPHLK